jgi:hypothetical protein
MFAKMRPGFGTRASMVQEPSISVSTTVMKPGDAGNITLLESH